MPARLRRSLRERGVGGTAARFLRRRLRRLAEDVHGRRFDRRLGVDTRGFLYHDPADESRREALPFQSVREDDFAAVDRGLTVDRTRTLFIDLGCGKGKALVLAYEAGFHRVLGVELSPELAAIAGRNVAHVVGGDPAEYVVVADATCFDFPPEPFVLFLYDPFTEPVLERVLDNLEASLARDPRRVVIAYVYPRSARVVAERSWLREAGRGHRHVIYESI